jgi:sugar lactone lactonase YvrE
LFVSLSAQKITSTAGGFLGDGGPATSAGLIIPRFAIEDSSGNLFISDSFDHRIRKVTPAGVISTFAGTGIAGFSGDGGLAKNAMFAYPAQILFDSAGNMIVADQGNNRVRSISPAGIVSTIAGTGTAGYSGDGGPAIAAQLNNPWGLVLDLGGKLYFTDINNQVVRKIDTSGIITTVAGNGILGYSGDGGPAILASMNYPSGLALDPSGNLYIADRFNHVVRIVNSAGIINTFAGDGIGGFSGDGGPALSAAIGNPKGLLIRNNQLFIGGAGQSRVRVVNLKSTIINTFAGFNTGYDGGGNPPLLTDFNAPVGLFFTASGSLLVADSTNSRIRDVTPAATTTIAGGFASTNGRATAASLIYPENLAFDSSGNYYIADYGGNRILKVTPSGQLSTFAGTGVSGFSGDGGPANQAQVYLPLGVAADNSGNVFIADTSNAVIRKVDSTGTISTFATDPNFSDLVSLAIDSAGNIYSADDSACAVRKITPAGAISVIAGIEFNCGYSGDGGLATAALLNSAFGVAVDSKGNLYIGDTFNNRVRKVNRSGIIFTIAGNGNCGFSGDGGPGTAAMICNPEAVAVDSKGNVYIGDYSNFRIRKINSAGNITTIAGSGNGGYNGENLPAVSTNLDGPVGVALDNTGHVFLLDDVQHRVRKIH